MCLAYANVIYRPKNIMQISITYFEPLVLIKINDINRINRFLRTVNYKLAENSIFIGCAETYVQRKNRLLKKYPFLIAQIYFFLD